jgi:Protein of unknown function (DUF2786)
MNQNGNSKLMEKIRALFRLADTTRGATKAEAELALQRAQELMTKHGIDQIDVEDIGESAREARAFNIHQRKYDTGRPRWVEDIFIAQILQQCFNVKVVWSRHYQKTRTGSFKECITYILIGEPTDTEIAVMACEELYPMMWGLYRQYLTGEGLPNTNTFKQSFYRGIQDGFIAASNRGRDSAMAEAGVDKADRYAIVIVDKKKAIQKWTEENMSLRKSRGYGSRAGHDDQAYGAGYKAGGNIRVGQRKIGGGGSKQIQ